MASFLVSLLAVVAMSAPAAATPRPAHGLSAKDAPAKTPVSAGAKTPVGMSFGSRLYEMSSAEQARVLDDAVATGVTWIREDLPWDSVQWGNRNAWYWTRFDTLVANAKARGLTVLPIVGFTPDWARAPGCVTRDCPPHNANAFAKFVAAAAERYAPHGVHTWEIWNEPNTNAFRGYKPARYAAVLSKTYAAVKAVNPKATVIFGGLAAGGDEFFDPANFLRRVCALGANMSFDAIAVHPYTWGNAPAKKVVTTTEWNLVAKLQRVAASPACGRARIPMWLTEFGAPSAGPTVDSRWTEARQAQVTTEGVAAAAADPSIAGIFMYTNQDLNPKIYGKGSFETWYGLRRLDGTAKPAYWALKRATASVVQR